MTGIDAYIAMADDLAAECCGHGERDGWYCAECDKMQADIEDYLYEPEDVDRKWRDAEHSRLMDEYGLTESDFH